MTTDKAEQFASLWRSRAPAGAPEPKREFRFMTGRKFKFDFAWPRYRVALEVDGGNHMARIVTTKHGKLRAVAVGRHTQDSDMEKLNLAAELGWRVLRYSPEMLDTNPQEVVMQVARTLTGA